MRKCRQIVCASLQIRVQQPCVYALANCVTCDGQSSSMLLSVPKPAAHCEL